MNNIKRYFNVFLGSILIAFSISILIIPNGLLTFGSSGLAVLLHYFTGFNPAINLLLINIFILLLASIIIDKNVIKKYILPSILITILLFIMLLLSKNISVQLPEVILVIIVSSTLSGYGYSLIYKEGYFAGTIFLIEEIISRLTKFHSKLYSWVFDILILIISIIKFNYEYVLYSFIIMFITKYMITKARFGINDSKMFYIITAKEKEVKNYIMHDLKYELSILDIKGGFSKDNKKILLTVISTNDYYKLKEGIKVIDNNAFIAITDTYDVSYTSIK